MIIEIDNSRNIDADEQSEQIENKNETRAVEEMETKRLIAELLLDEPPKKMPVKGKSLIEFFTPSELKNFHLSKELLLVGKSHIIMGEKFVIGGAPGVGKSRAAVGLAVAGATGKDWFGLQVHRKFKTMILQTENSQYRLKQEFTDLDCGSLDDYVRICTPPNIGLAFEHEEFRDCLAEAISDFKPDVLVIDPWNRVAMDDKQRDYYTAFQMIDRVLSPLEIPPAVGIVAHTRKPKSDEHVEGRGLLNLLSGSHMLGSVPRAVFILRSFTDDTEDDRVVWSCVKNNNGDLGEEAVWKRRNGLFDPCSDVVSSTRKRSKKTIEEEDIAKVFEQGGLDRQAAIEKLMALTGYCKSTCYEVLKLDGKFKDKIKEEDGRLYWIGGKSVEN
ncbi:MAG: AAA family ATPase [Verrucomicrobiae bacterium]|nr:AAA family ATPase [Verrucomicrobiae bacterium]